MTQVSPKDYALTLDPSTPYSDLPYRMQLALEYLKSEVEREQTSLNVLQHELLTLGSDHLEEHGKCLDTLLRLKQQKLDVAGRIAMTHLESIEKRRELAKKLEAIRA